MKKIYAKTVGNSKGETITETLVSVLVITLAMVMLAGGIVSAARVNRKVKDANTAFSAVGADTSAGTATVKHTVGGSNTYNVAVTVTNDNNSYVYYEKND